MAQPKPIRGLSRNQELKPGHDRVDFRRPHEKFRDWMVESSGGPMMLLIFLATMLVFPVLLEPAFLIGMGFMYWLSKQTFHLPLRMPQSSGLLDHNDPRPDNYEPRKASGIVFLGNEMGTGKELWVNASDAGTHFLVFGTTGAGKAVRDDAMVHTPRGWVQADRIRVGDTLSTPDGRSSKVQAVYPQGEMEMYELVLDDGRRAEVSGDHLWEVHPFRQGAPLGTVHVEGGQVIKTLDLKLRLEHQIWPEGVDGLALPLTEAPEAPEAGWADGVEGQTHRFVQAATQGEAFVGAGDAGSRAQRQAVWKAILTQGLAQGWVEAYGRCRRIAPVSDDAAKAFLALTRSLGFWAKLNADGSVWVKEQQKCVRVLQVRALKSLAPCRCFKIEDSRGLFLMDDYVVTHNTEALVSMAYNALVQGSGFIYVDGKGDNSLFMKIFALARVAGREDDLLCINYMTGGRDVVGAQEDKLSNNLNPFTMGSAGSLTQLLVSLMPSGGGGDGGMWQGRAVSFMGGLMMALTHLRDTGQMRLGVTQIREHLTLEKVQELARRADMPGRVVDALQGYLKSLPGYQEDPKDGQQGEITTEQHGYLQMQFTRVMSSLADDYGYIFNTTRGEVDFLDVVLNNRILTVLLPSLEKSPEELSNLGKIIVASLKSMMATGLGDRIEGATAETIYAKATHAPNPFLVILDEYGYYVVAGAAVMPAQARSLNFSMVFAGQDFPSFKKNNNKEEAEATAANCNVYVFMKLRDTTDTAELFSKAAGKARVARISGYNRGTGMGNAYMDNQNASIQDEERGSILDLSDQLPGEAHVIFKSAVVRAKMFYAAAPEPKHMRLNHFLRVESPSSAEMASFSKKVEALRDQLSDTDTLAKWATDMPLPQPLSLADAALGKLLEEEKDPVKAALAALMAAHRLPYANAEAFGQASQRLSDDDDFDGDDDPGINVFTSDEEIEHQFAANTGTAARPRTPAAAARPRLDRFETQDAMMKAEIAAGAPPQVAAERAERTISDLEVATDYPNKENIPPVMDELSFVDEVLTGLESDLDPQEEFMKDEDDRF